MRPRVEAWGAVLYGFARLGKRHDPKLRGLASRWTRHALWWNQWLHRGLLFGVSFSFLANDQSRKPDKLCEAAFLLSLVPCLIRRILPSSRL